MQSKRYSSLSLLIAALFMLPQTLQAQSLERADGETVGSPAISDSDDGPISFIENGAIVITQSKDLDVASGGVRCGNSTAGYSTENSFYRVFDLSQYSEITDDFTVIEVAAGIAIGAASGETGWPESTPTQTGTIRLYNLTSPPSGGIIDAGALELVAETDFDIDGPAGARYLQTVEITGTFSKSQLLAVEMFHPTGDPETNEELEEPFSLSQGGNVFGSTENEYLASASCGITNPQDVTTLGDFASEWVLTVTGVLGAVSNEDGAVAQRVTLGQAYPNPVAGQASIPFSLENAQHVRIAVYDALGREVAVAADRAFGAGEQSVVVSASGLPSGVYFYRISTESQTLTRKMVVTQ